MLNEQITFNGIDAGDGRYLHPATTAAGLAEQILAERPPDCHAADLRLRKSLAQPRFGIEYGRDPEDLAQAGWALVAAADTPPAVIAALEPLCAHRHDLAGDLFRTFTGEAGVRPGERKADWLQRHDVGPGPADPRRVPYYVMLVGGPESISFRFQYELDVQYAVGRIAFDTPEEYAQYAAKAVAASGKDACAAPGIGVFGPANHDDAATALSMEHLLEPMAREIVARAGDCCVTTVVGEVATKSGLADLLWGSDGPDVVFIASHGIGFKGRDPRQREAQGGLLCQDWPGPVRWRAPIPENFYLAGNDVEHMPIRARIVFGFACYGAGTPAVDDFDHLRGMRSRELTEQPFVARLPQRLLANPGGATVAFVGHVDRAWGCSFHWPGAGAQRTVFTSTLASVIDGRRVGHALDYFNLRYAELAAELSSRVDEILQKGKRVKAAPLAAAWIATNDARGYVVLGDPAVRIERENTTTALAQRDQPAL